MIATGLIFLFGASLATLAALLLTPLVWRKAQSLARREFEATIPVSANEIRAEFDRVRAEAALVVRRHEIMAGEAREKVARTQAELGRSTVESTGLVKRNRHLSELLAERDGELADLREALARGGEDRGRLEAELAAARRDGQLTAEELEALARRFHDVGEIAEERKIQLVALETRLDQLSDAMRVAERAGREAAAAIARLGADKARLEGLLEDAKAKNALRLDERVDPVVDLSGADGAPGHGPLPVDAAAGEPASAGSGPLTAEGDFPPSPSAPGAAALPAASIDRAPEAPSAGQRLRSALGRPGSAGEPPADEAEIRERIADIAARVIRMTADAEGEASPIPDLLSGSAGSDGVAGPAASPARDGLGSPSLAARVRLLAEAEGGARRTAGRRGGAGLDQPGGTRGE